LLMATCIGLIMIPAMRLTSTLSLWLFLPSVAVTAWSWMTWNLMALDGITIDGAWFNVSFSIAILLAGLGVANWQLEHSENPAWDRLCEGFLRLLPLLSVVVASGAVIVTTAHPDLPAIVRKATLVGSLTVIVLAMIRQGMLLKERDQLLSAQEEIIRGKTLLQSVLDTAPTRVFWKDQHLRYLGCNTAFAIDAGADRPEDVIGKSDQQLAWREQAALYQADDRAVMESGQAKLGFEEPQTTPDGRTIWLRTSKVPLRDSSGQVIGVLGVYEDITLLKLHERKLEHIAHYDALTGIPNRTLLADRLRQAIAQSRRNKRWLGVCYLDLDGFKPINDRLGHEAGDRVLIEIARRIGHTIRSGDTVARLGGDEFVVLLLALNGPDDCIASLERLLTAIAQPVVISDQSFTVTASIGITLFPQDDEDSDTLLRHADQAMYLAKQRGKNGYQFYDAAQAQRIRSQNKALERLRQALANAEFELFYQPKVDMQSHRIEGAEALIRWRHPERGLLAPSEFLPVIERTDLEKELGDWVLDAALEQLRRWRQVGLDLEVSVNISGGHLLSPGFAADLRRKLAAHDGLSRPRLQVEVLETEALGDITLVASVMESCRGFGVSFALDDFGTGYSSLAYLRNLPATTLKIDQSFVRDMLVDEGDFAIVQGIVILAKAFDRKTVAEGVETMEHYATLRRIGCAFAQGYAIARPMPADELARWCQERQNGVPSSACFG
ncbi:MAG: diguanylate cyclase/phosphodiesterase with sensor(s), partial [Proteobacteria bacterium]|nr:diguanylate cyclase/phosphodiesterase with sensor(s) [Pseudomonadota bacterium]